MKITQTRGNPPVNLVSTALANHCTDGAMPAGASVQQPVFLTIHDDHVYVADRGCSKVRRFELQLGNGPRARPSGPGAR